MDMTSVREIFAAVGREYGYEDVEVDFVPYRDMKVRWQRTTEWISFSVSDYLMNAPTLVLEDFARLLFKKIAGEKADWSDRFRVYICDGGFVEKNRPLLLKRFKGVKPAGEHRCRSLEDSIDRLMAEGLISDVDEIEFRYASGMHRASHVSVVMRTVIISDRLDSEDVPEYVLDAQVYKGICQVMAGFDACEEARQECERRMKRFSRMEEGEKWCMEHGLIREKL